MSNYAAMSDHELVRLYEQGIDEVFDLLLERNQEHLFSYILRLTQDQDLANDVFQETFIKAIVCIRGHQYRTTGKFSAWLMRIAHNLVIDNTRSAKNMPHLDDKSSNEALYNNASLAEDSCEAEMLRMADNDTISRLISLLPAAQQEIVHLRFYEDLSFKEIAEITNVSINTALGRMRYATINLRRMILDRGLDLAV